MDDQKQIPGKTLPKHFLTNKWFQSKHLPEEPTLNHLFNQQILGGGLFFFCFHPDPWGNDPIWRAYFSNGLKPPPRLALQEFFNKNFSVIAYYHLGQKLNIKIIQEFLKWVVQPPTRRVSTTLNWIWIRDLPLTTRPRTENTTQFLWIS